MSRRNLQHITLKADFSSEDRTSNSESDFEFGAGFAPYLRGISSTMYIRSPWKIQQSAEFNNVADYNAFYKRLFKAGQRHFHLDFEWNQNETVCIETLEDFKTIFRDIPLEEISISLKDNTSAIPLLAFYILTAEAQGANLDTLKGTFIIDVLEDFNRSRTAQVSEKLTSDSLSYTHSYLPLFKDMSISGMSLHGLSPENELALLLIRGNNQLKEGLASGLKIDDIAPRLGFNFAIGLDHFSEIAKLRAVRLLWAKIVKSYHPKHENSLALHINSTVNTFHLKDLETDTSITKVTIKVAAAVFGGVQCIETATGKTSTQESERLERHIHCFLQAETQITKTVDPWAGSFYIEKQTEAIAKKAWDIFNAFETSGIYTEAIQAELLQLESEPSEKEYSTQKRQSTIINRNSDTVRDSLLELTKATKKSAENRLTLAINAVKAQATLSEIHKALN